MFLKDYIKQGISLESLSVRALESIDIQSITEQQQIQSLLDLKRQFIPTDKQIRLPSDKTDFKSKEEELAFQKIIDERKAKLIPQPKEEKVIETKIKEEVKTEQVLTQKIAKLKKQKET